MCRIREIDITGYRGIAHLELSGLSRVNIVLGNNNNGKTTLLESVLILMGAHKPSLLFEMNQNRNYVGFGEDDFAAFFHNLRVDKPIRMNATFVDGGTRQLSVSYRKEEITETDASTVTPESGVLFPGYKYMLDLNYNDSGQSSRSTIVYSTAEHKLSAEGGVGESRMPMTFYVAPRYNFNDYVAHFNDIVTNKETENIVKILQAIEPRIQDVTIVNNVVMVDVGLDKLIPINLLGDGTRKLFTVSVALYNARNSILNIDEVDNGMYYASMKTLWEIILRSARDLNVQLFISTHSLDSLRALNDLLSGSLSGSQDDVKVFTLRKDKADNITAYPYNYEKFNYLIDGEEEIR